MDQIAIEAFLYTSDFGEDAYLFNSSSSSDSEDDIECTCLEQLSKKSKLDGYVEIEVPKLNEYDFRHNFRVNRDTFGKVLEMLHEDFSSEHKGGRERVNLEKATYILLWYLGNQETFRQMSERFKTTLSCIHNIIKIGTKSLSDKMHDHIMWPSTEEYPSISKMFQDICHLQRCLGILGVSYIKIPKPKEPDNYKCLKNFHSIVLQGAVTINGKFMNIFITEGSNELECVLEKSSLFIEAENGLFEDYYLLGFSKYMSRSWLVQPFKENPMLTPAQQFFNTCHETATNVFSESLGVLKGRFQRLQHFENRDILFIIQCVEAACTIHNIAIDCDEDTSDYLIFDTGIFADKSMNSSDPEAVDDGGSRMRVFQELIRAEEGENS